MTQQQWKYLWAGSNQSSRPSIESMGKYVHTLDNKRVGEHTEREIFTERYGIFVRRFVADINIIPLSILC